MSTNTLTHTHRKITSKARDASKFYKDKKKIEMKSHKFTTALNLNRCNGMQFRAKQQLV